MIMVDAYTLIMLNNNVPLAHIHRQTYTRTHARVQSFHIETPKHKTRYTVYIYTTYTYKHTNTQTFLDIRTQTYTLPKETLHSNIYTTHTRTFPPANKACLVPIQLLMKWRSWFSKKKKKTKRKQLMILVTKKILCQLIMVKLEWGKIILCVCECV